MPVIDFVDRTPIVFPANTPAPYAAWTFNWLPAATGDALYAFALINAATFCVFVYDIFVHYEFSYRFFRESSWRNTLSLTNIGFWYHFSRLATLGALILSVIFFNAHDGVDCNKTWIAYGIFFCISNAANSFLLGMRACALCRFDKRIVIPLMALWVVVLAFDTTISWAAGGTSVVVGEKQVGCIPAPLLTINGVNFNIAPISGTLGYDIICAVVVFVRLASIERASGGASSNKSNGEERQQQQLLTPFLRKQTAVLYTLVSASSLAFIIVSANPGEHLNTVASIVFANPYVALQTIIIGYIFRGLHAFSQSRAGKQAVTSGGHAGGTRSQGAGQANFSSYQLDQMRSDGSKISGSSDNGPAFYASVPTAPVIQVHRVRRIDEADGYTVSPQASGYKSNSPPQSPRTHPFTTEEHPYATEWK